MDDDDDASDLDDTSNVETLDQSPLAARALIRKNDSQLLLSHDVSFLVQAVIGITFSTLNIK